MLVSMADYSCFVDDYFGKIQKSIPTYRFGQAFWNRFLTLETQLEEELFFCQDQKKAEKIIWDNYIIKDQME